MKGLARTAVGFLVAPLAPGLFVLSLSLPLGKPEEGLWTLEMSAFAGYSAAIVLGLPAYHALRLFGRNGLVAYALTGLAIGLVVGAAFLYPLFLHAALLGAFAGPIAAFCLAGFFGVLAAAAFWAIRRPDRQVIPGSLSQLPFCIPHSKK
jgi:hypothetical protein